MGTVALPWGTVRATSLTLNGSPVDTSQITSRPNRIISGKKRTSSNQPAYITPNGAAATAIIAGATTSLSYDVSGTTCTVSTDITISSLTLAPSSNNTCLVNDSTAASQDDTRYWGEDDCGKKITVDAMGSNISALVGKYAAFKVGTEYFLAYVESSTVLSRAKRGYYYNSSLAPLNRTTLADNATITLMSLGWVFAENNGTTINVSYSAPTWSYTAPSGPATGDYWYDQANSVWKRYNGASWDIISRTLIGQVVMDSTNCVAARCEDFYAKYESNNTVEYEINSTSVLQVKHQDGSVNVAGNLFYFGKTNNTFNITTQLAASTDMYNATEQASTQYFGYVKDTGEYVISDIAPYYRQDLYGHYHPHNPWRAVVWMYNDGSSNITLISNYSNPKNEVVLDTGNGNGAVNTAIRRFTNSVVTGKAITYTTSANIGTELRINESGLYTIHCSDLRAGAQLGMAFSKNSPDLTTAPGSMSSGQAAYLIAYNIGPSASTTMTSCTVYLDKGDIVRPHYTTASSTNVLDSNLRMTKVSQQVSAY